MPMHDWKRVPSGLFHHFHQDWSIELARCLNRGLLPKGVSALVEQRSGPKEPDVLAIETRSNRGRPFGGGTSTLERPASKMVRRTSKQIYATRANLISVKHHLGRTLAVIEIVSPGNKQSRAAMADFVEKLIDFLRNGIHVLLVDLFPPSQRDPFGLHKVIWDEIGEDEPFEFPSGTDRLLASYDAGREKIAYIETIGVGNSLPEMPLYLSEDFYVKVPLESSYRTAWEASAEDFREAVETGILPAQDTD